jgi:hypothetical protein
LPFPGSGEKIEVGAINLEWKIITAIAIVSLLIELKLEAYGGFVSFVEFHPLPLFIPLAVVINYRHQSL